MTIDDDINQFIQILKEDIRKLENGFKENGIEFKDKDSIYLINFNLFIELTKKYCFENKTTTVYRPTSIIPPETESKLVPVTIIPIPEEHLSLFKDIVLTNFEEKWTFSLSFVRLSRSENYKREKLYYRFFYALFNGTLRERSKVEEIFKNLIRQWNRALAQQRMIVDLFLPLDSVTIIGKEAITIENKFKVGNITAIVLEKTAKGIDDWRFYTSTISCKLELITKIFTSDNFSDPTYKDDNDKYESQYQEALKELHLLVNAFYLNCYDFIWRSPVIKLPWWFDPELFNFQDLQRQPGLKKFMKMDALDDITTMYLDLKKSNLIDKDLVILNGYFRIYQHGILDAYFIIDIITFLEALYTKGSMDYVKLRLRLNSASNLARFRKKYWKIYDFMGKIYDIRSNAVHGSNWSVEFEKYVRKRYCLKEGDITIAIVEFRKEIISYVKLSFTRLLEEMNVNSELLEEIKNDPLYFFNNGKLTKGERNRNDILEVLKRRYEKLDYKYENKWQEISGLFNIEDIN